jgi:single-stranded DNA-binding protein
VYISKANFRQENGKINQVQIDGPTEIVGSELTMLGSRQSNSNNGMATDQSESPFPQDDAGTGLTDDDIPF